MMTTKSVTLRVGSEDLQIMEDYLAEHTDQSASDFIRAAIRSYDNGSEGGIFVRLNEVLLNTLSGMKEDGTIFSEEEFVRGLILEAVLTKDEVRDSAGRAFKSAQLAARMK